MDRSADLGHYGIVGAPDNQNGWFPLNDIPFEVSGRVYGHWNNAITDVGAFSSTDFHWKPVDVSRLARLNEIRRHVYATLSELRDSVRIEYTTLALEEETARAPLYVQDLWYGIHHREEAIRIEARAQALEYFGLAGGEQARRIAKQYTKYWSKRLEALLQDELVRFYFESLLRWVGTAIDFIVRLIRVQDFALDLIVRQASWYLLHGEHPPHNSGRNDWTPIFWRGRVVLP